MGWTDDQVSLLLGMAGQGVVAPDIAPIVGHSAHAVRRKASRIRASLGGGRGNDVRRWRPEEEATVLDCWRRGMASWRIADTLADRHGRRVCDSRIRQWICRHMAVERATVLAAGESV